MRDLSMHILDIVMNSIRAKATLIEITVIEKNDTLTLEIKDNGIGMGESMLQQVKNPFFTTRTTRRVGLGLSLLLDNAKKTGGKMEISSKEGVGTTVEAMFHTNHIDCIPKGNIDETIISLIMLEPDLDFIYNHTINDNYYQLNTLEIKKILHEVPINENTVIEWLKEDLIHKFS